MVATVNNTHNKDVKHFYVNEMKSGSRRNYANVVANNTQVLLPLIIIVLCHFEERAKEGCEFWKVLNLTVVLCRKPQIRRY